MPKVSIIVPIYNAQNGIERCVKSILGQEYKDIEVLLMDDGSQDDSGKMIDVIAQSDDRVRVIHKENTGVSDTRNQALAIARGEYIQFLDADDWMSSNSTKELVRAIEQYDADLVVGEFYRVVGDNLSRKGSIGVDKVLNLKEYAQYMMDSPADYYYGVLWNKLYKKSIIDLYSLQMDPSLSFCEDFIFNLEYTLHCKRIYPLQVPIYYYVRTEGSLVSQNTSISNIYNMKINVFQYYEKFFREVLDEEEYREERMGIAKFYIMGAKDEYAFPLLPGTKKVGEELVPVHFKSDYQTNIPVLMFYCMKVYYRLLNTIAEKYKLDLKDIRVIEAMYRTSHVTVKSIGDYTGMAGANVMLVIQKLRGKSYVKMMNSNLEFELQLMETAKPICDEIDKAVTDLENVCTQNFETQDKAILDKYMVEMVNNLKEFLQ